MSDATSKRKPKTEVIEDAVVVEDDATDTPAEPRTDTAVDTAVETVVVEERAETAPSQPQVVYVQAPAAPVRKGNRGMGALIAVLSGVLFTAVLAVITAVAGLISTRRFSFAFLADPQFYIPTLFFVIGFVLLVLLANRANWWAYIFGSILVGLLVYFGSIGLGLLANGVIFDTPAEAGARYAAQLGNPFVLVSALLAREVSLWTGSIIARRGRKLKVRNAEARDAWEREVAEKRAEHERAAAGSSAAL